MLPVPAPTSSSNPSDLGETHPAPTRKSAVRSRDARGLGRSKVSIAERPPVFAEPVASSSLDLRAQREQMGGERYDVRGAQSPPAGRRSINDRTFSHAVAVGHGTRDKRRLHTVAGQWPTSEGEVLNHGDARNAEARRGIGDTARIGQDAEGQIRQATQQPAFQAQARGTTTACPARSDDHVGIINDQLVDQVWYLGCIMSTVSIQRDDHLSAGLFEHASEAPQNAAPAPPFGPGKVSSDKLSSCALRSAAATASDRSCRSSTCIVSRASARRRPPPLDRGSPGD